MISKTKMRRYRILRILFGSEGRGFDEIKAMVETNELDLIHEIRYLKSRNQISSEKEYYAEESQNTNEIKTGYHNRYTLTKIGIKKLAWMEYQYQLYKEWQPPWASGGDPDYNREITSVIKENNYFGISPK